MKCLYSNSSFAVGCSSRTIPFIICWWFPFGHLGFHNLSFDLIPYLTVGEWDCLVSSILHHTNFHLPDKSVMEEASTISAESSLPQETYQPLRNLCHKPWQLHQSYHYYTSASMLGLNHGCSFEKTAVMEVFLICDVHYNALNRHHLSNHIELLQTLHIIALDCDHDSASSFLLIYFLQLLLIFFSLCRFRTHFFIFLRF